MRLVKRRKRKVAMPKPNSQINVGIHTKYVTADGYHRVHWGNWSEYNSNFRRFKSLRRAKAFAKKISKTGKYVLIED